MNCLSKNELVELVEKIQNADGSEAEIDAMLELLAKNVPHPEVSNLIFWHSRELQHFSVALGTLWFS